jgi:hypothetical protein
MTQERRLKKQMEESGREELTRRELIGLILKIQDGIWDLSDGELEDLAEVLGLDVECFKHGIFFVKTLDKDDD